MGIAYENYKLQQEELRNIKGEPTTYEEMYNDERCKIIYYIKSDTTTFFLLQYGIKKYWYDKNDKKFICLDNVAATLNFVDYIRSQKNIHCYFFGKDIITFRNIEVSKIDKYYLNDLFPKHENDTEFYLKQIIYQTGHDIKYLKRSI